jgi:nucleotide-binding universal stress UspA family protein
MMRKVVACVDNSTAARPVLAAAAAIAPLLDATVEAVHVREDGEATVDAIVEARHVELCVLQGDVVEELVSYACRPDVVATTVGAHDHSGRARHMGHVPTELADRSDAPVLVVPPDATFSGPVHRVLVAMEGKRGHELALKGAVDVAVDAKLEIIVVHVDDESSIPAFSDQIQHETDAYAAEFLARFAPSAPEAKLELRVGDPADEILRASETIKPELLAMGWRQRPAQAHEGVAPTVVARCRYPVLLVALSA